MVIPNTTNNPMQQFEDFCRSVGIPTDRISLVRRNVELKEQVKAGITMLNTMAKTFHDVYSHDEPYETCSRGSCQELRDFIKKFMSL